MVGGVKSINTVLHVYSVCFKGGRWAGTYDGRRVAGKPPNLRRVDARKLVSRIA